MERLLLEVRDNTFLIGRNIVVLAYSFEITHIVKSKRGWMLLGHLGKFRNWLAEKVVPCHNEQILMADALGFDHMVDVTNGSEFIGITC